MSICLPDMVEPVSPVRNKEAPNVVARRQIALYLRAVIKRAGWTQKQVAAMCSLTQPRVSELMRCKVDRFSLDALVSIADRLGSPVGWTPRVELHLPEHAKLLPEPDFATLLSGL